MPCGHLGLALALALVRAAGAVSSAAIARAGPWIGNETSEWLLCSGQQMFEECPDNVLGRLRALPVDGAGAGGVWTSFSPTDLHFVVIGTAGHREDKSMMLWSADTGKLVKKLFGITLAKFSPGGTCIYTYSVTDELVAWRVIDGERLSSTKVIWASTSTSTSTGTAGGSDILRDDLGFDFDSDISDFEKDLRPLRASDISPDGLRVLGHSSETLFLWDRSITPAAVLKYPKTFDPRFAHAFFVNGKQAIVRWWDENELLGVPSEAGELETIWKFDETYKEATLEPSGEHLAIIKEDKAYDTGDDSLEFFDIDDLKGDDDERGVRSCDLVFWDVSKQTLEQEKITLRAIEPLDNYLAPIFSHDGTRILVLNTTGFVQVFAKTGQKWEVVNAFDTGCLEAAFASNDVILSWSRADLSLGPKKGDGKVMQWRVQDGKHLTSFAKDNFGIQSVSVSPDGLRFVSTSANRRDDALTLWWLASPVEAIEDVQGSDPTGEEALDNEPGHVENVVERELPDPEGMLLEHVLDDMVLTDDDEDGEVDEDELDRGH